MKTYLVVVGKPKKGDKIMQSATTPEVWALWTYDDKQNNNRLVYPIAIGEMIEDEHGHVHYTYYGE